MISYPTFLSTFIVIVALFGSIKIGQIQCESFVESPICNLKEFESTWNEVAATGNENRHFPEDFSEMTTFCRNISHSLKKLEGFKKRHCFRNSLHTFISIFIYSVRQHQKRNCVRKPNAHSRQLISAGSCLNRNRVKINKCEQNINQNFILIQSAPNKQKIPYLCCQFVEFIDCLEGILDKTCREQMSVVVDQFNSIMGNYRDTTCGEYNEESDKCNLLGSPRKLSKHLNSKQKHSKSFILNLAEIFDRVEL